MFLIYENDKHFPSLPSLLRDWVTKVIRTQVSTISGITMKISKALCLIHITNDCNLTLQRLCFFL